jgi:hypothetical protein
MATWIQDAPYQSWALIAEKLFAMGEMKALFALARTCKIFLECFGSVEFWLLCARVDKERLMEESKTLWPIKYSDAIVLSMIASNEKMAKTVEKLDVRDHDYNHGLFRKKRRRNPHSVFYGPWRITTKFVSYRVCYACNNKALLFRTSKVSQV